MLYLSHHLVIRVPCFRCIVEDGTGEAMVFIDDDKVVRQMLFVKESPWLELKNMIRKYGEVFYQRSAYWKVRRLNIMHYYTWYLVWFASDHSSVRYLLEFTF